MNSFDFLEMETSPAPNLWEMTGTHYNKTTTLNDDDFFGSYMEPTAAQFSLAPSVPYFPNQPSFDDL
jgi:hypothetical protein